MATAVRRSRFVPDPVVVLAVVAGLLVGLATLCCCVGEHAVTHGTGRIVAGPAVVSDTVADAAVAGDPPDQDAEDTGDGCPYPGDHPAAVVTSGGAVTRDLPAVAATDGHRPHLLVAGPAVAAGGTAARAPASHLLCIMRT